MTKKFFITSVCFVLVFLAGYFLAYMFFFNTLFSSKYNSKISPSKRTLETFFASKQDYDVLFLGSSHAYRSFDPRIFAAHGIKSYNLGTTSQAPVNSYELLKRSISRTKAVVLEVYPDTISSQGRESYLDFLVNSNSYSLILDMAIDIWDTRYLSFLAIKKIIDHENKDTQVKNESFFDGYVETNSIAKENTKYESYVLNEQYIEEQIKYLNKIIKLCKDHGVKLSFVYAPVPAELTIAGEHKLLVELSDLGQANGVSFYNIGRNHNLDSKRFFFDDDHLNKEGVSVFNKMLISAMHK